MREVFKPGDVVEVAGRKVRLKVNARARRVSLRVDAVAAEVVAVAPSARRLTDAVAFARDRAAWIDRHMARRAEQTPFAPGSSLTLRGEPVRLEPASGAGAARLERRPDGLVLAAGGEGEAFARRVERFLRSRALDDLGARTCAHADALGLKPPRVSLGDAKTRWGSCTPARGTIRYNWRLVLAPPEVLDYVAAHEVAHLVHADHSAAFWSVVRKLYGDPAPARAWLRRHGAALHAVGR